MSLIYHVDAFTNQPFAGNPAAICILSEPAQDQWMQKVAQEINLSETAFLCKQGDDFDLRWFTPAVEIDLCGHATLASAHVLSRGSRFRRNCSQPEARLCFAQGIPGPRCNSHKHRRIVWI